MSKYTKSVDHYLDGCDHVSPGACPGCDECGLADVDTMDCPEYELAGESHFSWCQCDGCGSTFGGDRYPAHYVDENKEIMHLDVCVDCLFYLANGDEPEEWAQHPG